MKYAIISDIHSNLEAFERTLLEIDDIGVNGIICLGDIVGYGASPNECVDIVRERNIISIVGNHDVVACGKKEPMDFNPIAREAALWTRDELTKESEEYLNNLPQAKEIEDFLVVHGSLTDPNFYIFSDQDASIEFSHMVNHNICFFGHTHVRIYYVYLNNLVESFDDDSISINGNTKYLINPGSVGQPRDGDSRASFLIFDENEKQIDFVRLDYDIDTAQEKIIQAGLDRKLAYRLSLGL